MRSTFRVLFYTKKQTVKNGHIPVMGSITVNRTTTSFSCKRDVPLHLGMSEATVPGANPRRQDRSVRHSDPGLQTAGRQDQGSKYLRGVVEEYRYQPCYLKDKLGREDIPLISLDVEFLKNYYN